MKDITLMVTQNIVVDGNNAPTFYTSLSATDVSESSVVGSKFVAAFRNHMFYAGNLLHHKLYLVCHLMKMTLQVVVVQEV